MKVKKLFKFLNSICNEDNCKVGKCPFAEWGDESHNYSSCLVRNELGDQWDVENLVIKAKLAREMKKARML